MNYKKIKIAAFAIICNSVIITNLTAVGGPGLPPPPPPPAVPEFLSVAPVLGITIFGLFLLRWKIGKK